MGKFIDLTGQRFGRLIVIERAGTNTSGAVSWRCKCDCGSESVVVGQSLRQGFTQSCGCFNREQSGKREYKHGMVGTRLYKIWDGMVGRCHRKNHKHYPNYGGRGITVCDEWRSDFAAFMKWALSSGYQDNLTIDRRNNNKGYSPDNCGWVTFKSQQNNKRDNHLITYNGVTHTLTEWSEIKGINRNTLSARLNRLKWPVDKALSSPRH